MECHLTWAMGLFSEWNDWWCKNPAGWKISGFCDQVSYCGHVWRCCHFYLHILHIHIWHIYKYKCISIRVYACIYRQICEYIHFYGCIYQFTCIYIEIEVYIYILYIYIHICRYICMCLHLNIRLCALIDIEIPGTPENHCSTVVSIGCFQILT